MNPKILDLKILFFLFIILVFTAISKTHAGDTKVIQEKTFKTEAGKNLRLDAASGDVYVSTWDKPEVSVKISGNKKAYDKVKFRYDNDQDGVTIVAKRESWISFLSWGGIYLKFEIKIPSNYNTLLSTAGGDIRVSDLKGIIKVKTSGGDINIRNTRGIINSSTSGGDIRLEENNGEINVSTSGGDIIVKDFSGNVALSTSGGDIQLNGADGRIKAETSGGDINLVYSGNNEGISLHTTGGDIFVKVPKNFSARADLSTTGGDVECELPITSHGKFTSSKLKGEINGGGRLLNCYTSGGDIKVIAQ